MHRRAFLAASVAAVTVGCLDDGSDDGSTNPSATGSSTSYETCEREVVSYGEFPDEIRAEIDAAIESTYEADTVHLASAIDVEETYVDVAGTYYRATVEVDGGIERLRLSPDEEPELDSRSFTVENGTESRLDGSLVVRTDDGETLLERDLDVEPGDGDGFSLSRVGTHTVAVEPSEGEGEPREDTVVISPEYFGGHVLVTEEGVETLQSVADLVPCPWDG